MCHPARGSLRSGLAGAPAGIPARDIILVSPLVTTFVAFSLPWLPEMALQCPKLQKQTAARGQCLEAKVKSLQQLQLAVAPGTAALWQWVGMGLAPG